jgi:hypothetical protein
MAKEVAQLTIEKAKAEELAIQRGESRSRKSAKTKKRETEKQARENLGISHQVSSRDERTMAAVDRFPLLESWGQRTVLRAAEGIGNLPKNEHKGAEYLLGTFERGEQVIACEALENMIDHLEPDLRKEIYKRARSGDPDQVLRAQTTAAALYPVPDSWFGSLAIALKELKRVVKGRKKQDFAQGRIRAAYQELDRAVSFMNDEYKEVRAEVLAELKGKAR